MASTMVPFDRLLDRYEGRLSEEDARATDALLAEGDAATQASAAWIATFILARRRVHLADPPPELHRALVAQFQPGAVSPIAHRIRALLSFDSARNPALAGVRSVSASTRQLIYECGLVDVALNVRPGRQSDRLDVNGQVFPRLLGSAAGLVARLTRDDTLMDISLTSDLGEFSFTDLPPGPYALELFVEDSQVEIDTFEVQLHTSP